MIWDSSGLLLCLSWEEFWFMYNPNRIQLVKITIYPEFTSISWESINRIMAKLPLNSITKTSINFQYSWDFFLAKPREPRYDVHCSQHSNLLVLCDRVRRFCTFVKCVRPFLSMTLNQTSKMLNTTTLFKLYGSETILCHKTKEKFSENFLCRQES